MEDKRNPPCWCQHCTQAQATLEKNAGFRKGNHSSTWAQYMLPDINEKPGTEMTPPQHVCRMCSSDRARLMWGHLHTEKPTLSHVCHNVAQLWNKKTRLQQVGPRDLQAGNFSKGCIKEIWCSGVVSNWRSETSESRNRLLSLKKCVCSGGRRHEQGTLTMEISDPPSLYSTCSHPNALKAAQEESTKQRRRCRRVPQLTGAATHHSSAVAVILSPALEYWCILKVSIIFTAWVPQGIVPSTAGPDYLTWTILDLSSPVEVLAEMIPPVP